MKDLKTQYEASNSESTCNSSKHEDSFAPEFLSIPASADPDTDSQKSELLFFIIESLNSLDLNNFLWKYQMS